MDSYKDTSKYKYLNIAFKVFVVIFFFLFFIFYFNINIFKLNFFKKPSDIKNYSSPDSAIEVNRIIQNASINQNFHDKKISDFYIKTALNCCLNKKGIADVEHLKKIISQGFRCLDFKLVFKNNTLHIENQPSDQTFYNALEIIDSHCFSKSFCNNFNDPVFINIRLHKPDIENPSIYKPLYNKLRQMFKTLNSKKIDTSFSMLEFLKNYNNKLSTDDSNFLKKNLKDIEGKIIVFCNYNYNTIEGTTINDEHELLQYIHLNSYIAENYEDLTDIVSNLSFSYNDNNLQFNNNISYFNFIVSKDNNNYISQNDNITNLVNLNKVIPSMILSTNNEPLDSSFDEFGYTFRANNFANVDNFDEINDPDLKRYNDDFNLMGSAFILKSKNRRTTEL